MEPTPSEIFNASKAFIAGATFPKRVLWLGGPPAAGKDTYSDLIREELGIGAPAIVISQLLTKAGFNPYQNKGALISDADVTPLLFKELSLPQYREGVVINGFPRTVPQAQIIQMLRDALLASKQDSKFQVVLLTIDEETSVARQLHRGQEALATQAQARATDLDPAVAHRRYNDYLAKTIPALSQLLKSFGGIQLDTRGSVESVHPRLKKELQALVAK